MMAVGSVDGAGVTGNALPEDIQRFKDGGADRVLTKPLTKAKLMGVLEYRLFPCVEEMTP